MGDRSTRFALAVSAAILLVLLGVESTLYEQRIKTTNTQLEKTVKSFFGALSPSAVKSYLSNTKNLKRNIDAELSKERALVALLAPNPNSPFEFLKDISSAIPRGVVTDLMHYHVGSSTNAEPYSSTSVSEPAVELEFWVANPQMADGIDRALSGKIKGYRKSDLAEVDSAAAPGTPKKFKMSINGVIGDAASGK
jgi:hypothetical protein